MQLDSTSIGVNIKKIVDETLLIDSLIKDDNALVNYINSISSTSKQTLYDYYKDREGIIIDIRKFVATTIIKRKITLQEIKTFENKQRALKPGSFRTTRTLYAILFPFVTSEHEPIKEFVNAFIEKLIIDLGLKDVALSTFIDFQGARQQGSNRLWFAIYNKAQADQSTSKQLFFDFFAGKYSYGLNEYEKQFAPNRIEVADFTTFDYDAMLKNLEPAAIEIKNDVGQTDTVQEIDLGSQNLFKISHGSFKSGAEIATLETFKKNKWIVIYEVTGRKEDGSVANFFKENIKKGDYVYITIGGDYLYNIARVVSDEWEYVPDEVTDAAGWIFKEVEYIKEPIDPDTSDLKAYNTKPYPSYRSTIAEIGNDQLNEMNDVLFQPHYNVKFSRKINTGSHTPANNSENMTVSKLNTILYGPPGTGKTYSTIRNAIKIADPDYYSQYEIANESNDKKLKERFDEILITDFENNNQSGQIAFCTFHQSMSYEDFIEGIKPLKPDPTSQQVKYDIVDGIFKRLCNFSEMNFEKAYSLLQEDLIKSKNSLVITMKASQYKIFQIDTNGSIKIENSAGKRDNTKTKETLRSIYEDFEHIEKYITGGMVPYYSPLAKKLFEYATPKKYVLIIDEINRGNISQIFGELITLIEEDKREGKSNQLTTVLPYSKKSFSVPSNLHIIGTMNTADRSVEALDTALRRRFSFIEMPPQAELLEGKFEVIKGVSFGLKQILETINKRIQKLLNRDHLIGHSYFLEVANERISLKESFANNIIPLLQEYFYGDYAKMCLVLGSGFVNIDDSKSQEKDKSFFADDRHEASGDFLEKDVWKIENVAQMNDDAFAKALTILKDGVKN